jgi:hypothetical protein
MPVFSKGKIHSCDLEAKCNYDERNCFTVSYQSMVNGFFHSIIK